MNDSSEDEEAMDVDSSLSTRDDHLLMVDDSRVRLIDQIGEEIVPCDAKVGHVEDEIDLRGSEERPDDVDQLWNDAS